MLAPCEVLNVVVVVVVVICKAAYVLVLVSRSIHNRAQQVKISTV